MADLMTEATVEVRDSQGRVYLSLPLQLIVDAYVAHSWPAALTLADRKLFFNGREVAPLPDYADAGDSGG